jgi:hypothetical protein
MQHEFGKREIRQIEEAAIFSFLWKAAAFSLLSIVEISIFSNIPNSMSGAARMLAYFVLLFTPLQLLFILTVQSEIVRRHAIVLFGLGAAAILVGLWTGTFMFG